MSAVKPITYSPTEEDKGQILSHIYYEIWQLYGAITLSNIRIEGLPEKEQNIRNAILESSLVHARVLCDFFEKEKRKIYRSQELDDVLSTDFSFPTTTLSIDKIYRERLNKDIVHLSYSRTKRRIGVDKEWHYNKIFLPILQTSIEFIKALNADTIDSCKDYTPEHWEILRHRLATLCSEMKSTNHNIVPNDSQ